MRNILKITALLAAALLLITAVFITYSMNMKFEPDAEYTVENNLDSTLVFSDSIIIAKVDDVLPGRYSNNIHQLIDVQTIWGVQMEESISAHDGRKLEKGKTYMLFLWESTEYYYIDRAFELDSTGRLIPFTADDGILLNGIDTLDEFKAYLSANIGLLRPAPKSVPTYMHIDAQLESADIIAKIRFTDKILKAGSFCVSPYEIVEVYRGEKWPDNVGRHLSRPKNEEVIGNEYIIFMKWLDDGRLVPLSCNHSTLAMGDEWTEITLEYFE